MKKLADLPRWARWTAPAGTVLAACAVLAGSVISWAAAPPRLPARTAGQLLAVLSSKTPVPALSGTVTETVSLGLPELPAALEQNSLESLLAGSRTFKLWYSSPVHFRIAAPQNMSEDDLFVNGDSAWLWDSSANTATHFALPKTATAQLGPATGDVPLTPGQAATQVLALAGKTTAISVDPDVTVAGQPAYQIVLAPKGRGSLIGQVRIAIDARHHIPLRLQVFARGASSPAMQVGFTALSFGPPAAADYQFTVPAGAKVVQHVIKAGRKASKSDVRAKSAGGARGHGSGKAPGRNGISVIGSGWLSVLELPESSLASIAAGIPSGGAGSGGLVPFQFSSSQAAGGSAHVQGKGHAGSAPSGGLGPVLGALLGSARHVSGSWGSGRLLRTGLFCVLITSKGRVLVGAVAPSVLYRDAAQAGHARPLTWRHAASRVKSK